MPEVDAADLKLIGYDPRKDLTPTFHRPRQSGYEAVSQRHPMAGSDYNSQILGSSPPRRQ